jgi:hypothetical protein
MSLLVVGFALLHAMELPPGATPDPANFPWFPDRLHAYVWFNWSLVPIDRMAAVVSAEPKDIIDIAKRMGLPDPPAITADQQRRSYITVIRRNWHLLPYEQLTQLLGWTTEQLAYTLREDDFLYIKLGSLKPNCPPLQYAAPGEAAKARAEAIGNVLREETPDAFTGPSEPLFDFVRKLSKPPEKSVAPKESRFSPRFWMSYFMLYGDPFLETESDPYPDGYLERLAQSGVNGVWLQAVLYRLAPFPWDASFSEHYQERLENLAKLVARAKKKGISVYLYLNEPRAMPDSFFQKHPELKGVAESGFAAMCTSAPEVRAYIRDSVASICKAAPDLGGFFTITASENLTNCWSHNSGKGCPRCGERGPAAVIADVNTCIYEGIQASGAKSKLIAWDWGWPDACVKPIIDLLPKEVAFMSVSEWGIPIHPGGVKSVIGEYSLSVIGPSERTKQRWDWAREHGMKTIAKLQVNNTWELSSVPYIPAVLNVAEHAHNLLDAKIDGLMLGWTIGGCPSPNLAIYNEMGAPGDCSVDDALMRVATARFGEAIAPQAVKAWRECSIAFREFPFDGSMLYSAPQQMGPANPFWALPTGYAPTMVGLPYDNLKVWRGVFPEDVFIKQFDLMADGFEKASAMLAPFSTEACREESVIIQTCGIHFRSVANQARFVQARDALAKAPSKEDAQALIAALEQTLRGELQLAKTLYRNQCVDSRIGFEASNHYFYVPYDLLAKVVNCRYLLDTWLPELRKQHGV